MTDKKLAGEGLRNLLVNDWLTHDAICYREVDCRFGMAEAMEDPTR